MFIAHVTVPKTESRASVTVPISANSLLRCFRKPDFEKQAFGQT
jgi:hypothetical protein